MHRATKLAIGWVTAAAVVGGTSYSLGRRWIELPWWLRSTLACQSPYDWGNAHYHLSHSDDCTTHGDNNDKNMLETDFGTGNFFNGTPHDLHIMAPLGADEEPDPTVHRECFGRGGQSKGWYKVTHVYPKNADGFNVSFPRNAGAPINPYDPDDTYDGPPLQEATFFRACEATPAPTDLEAAGYDGIIVALPVATTLIGAKIHRYGGVRILTTDSGPNGSCRDKDGKILGCTQLCAWPLEVDGDDEEDDRSDV